MYVMCTWQMVVVVVVSCLTLAVLPVQSPGEAKVGDLDGHVGVDQEMVMVVVVVLVSSSTVVQ